MVKEANGRYTSSFELDKDIQNISGVLLTSDKDDLLFYRGSQSLHINKSEVFPEGYESKLLMSGINVNPNIRFHKLNNIPVENGKIDIAYTDNDDIRAEFTPYRVSLYLECKSETC